MIEHLYQLRVVEEKAELDDKIRRLSAFFTSVSYAGLAQKEQDLLQQQLVAMRRYSEVLRARLVFWGLNVREEVR